MSFVNVFIVKDDSLFFVRVHHRKLAEIVKRPQECLKNLRPKYLDAGYVVIDLNRNTIVDGQLGCFLRQKSDFSILR